MTNHSPMAAADGTAAVITVSAHAKINLCLDVLGRRRDGWHELDGIMHALTLADTVAVVRHDHLHLVTIDARRHRVSADGREVPEAGTSLPQGEHNLAWRAAAALQQAAGLKMGARIKLIKRIPLAAGLGGGSADAGAVLAALNRFWRLDWPPQRLADIGLALGADVPFALMGGAARARGVGERLEPLPPLAGVPVVLIPQPFAVLTADIFRAWDGGRQGDVRRPIVTAMAAALKAGNLPGTAAQCVNTLTAVTGRRHPQVQAALADLRRQKPLAASMTGTGPTLFGLFAHRQQARTAVAALRGRWPQARLTYLTGAGPVCRYAAGVTGPGQAGG